MSVDWQVQANGTWHATLTYLGNTLTLEAPQDSTHEQRMAGIIYTLCQIYGLSNA